MDGAGQNAAATELAEQVLPDGCHYERSPAYQCQVMADLLACRAALREPLPELAAALDRMAQALTLLTHPDGRSARSTMVACPWRRYPPNSPHARCPGRQGGRPDHGPSRCATPAISACVAPGELLLVDCGPLGPAICPVGHCDQLSFEWSTGGRRIVVDQGTHQYMAGPHRLTSRSTSSHNTVVVTAPSNRTSTVLSAAGGVRRPCCAAFEAGDGAMRLVGSHDATTTCRAAQARRIIAGGPDGGDPDRIEGAWHTAIAHLLLHPTARSTPEAGPRPSATARWPCTRWPSAPLTVLPALWYPDGLVSRRTTRPALPVPMGETGAWMALTAETRLLTGPMCRPCVNPA